MGGDDKTRVTHVFLAAWSPALKFTSDSSLNPKTVSTELSFAFPGEISGLAVCQKGKITRFFNTYFQYGSISPRCAQPYTLKAQKE